mgnify:CR=1 FL=1
MKYKNKFQKRKPRERQINGLKVEVYHNNIDMALRKLKRKVKNHLGSMYLGALAVGADITSGYFAFHYLKEHKRNISIIFKDFHADFYKRSMGNVVFTCDMGEEIKELIDRSLKSSGRLNLPVIVTAAVPSISDEVVAKFILTLSVKTK